MTRLFKLFLLVALVMIAVPVTFGVAYAAGVDGLLPPGASELVTVLTRWPVNSIEWVFTITGVVGMVVHWANGRRLGHTIDSFSEHFLTVDPHYSLATILVYWLAAMLILTTVAIAQAAWPGAAVGGFALGWMFDSWIAKAPK